MIVSDFFVTVRDYLQDDAGTRYTSPSLLRILNMGLLEMRQARPDYFIGRFATPTTQVSAVTDELAVPEICLPALVAYTVGMAEMRDDEYTADGRAAALLSKFVRNIGGS